MWQRGKQRHDRTLPTKLSMIPPGKKRNGMKAGDSFNQRDLQTLLTPASKETS